MKIAVTSMGRDLDAEASPKFGRCPMFLMVDTDTLQYDVIPNPAINAPGGAGVQAAELVAGSGVEAIITGELGPKALKVIQAAELPVYVFKSGTVRRAVEDFKSGKLELLSGSRAPRHRSPGQMGRLDTSMSRREEISALETELAGLRRQMTDILERIQQLEEVK
jgi:predicted Fe-Mo cluster-binding NifX family protein